MRVPDLSSCIDCHAMNALHVPSRSDLWPLGLTIALGLTNGHGQSLAMMHAPSTLPGGFTRDRCGPILNMAFTVGCTLGSCAAFGITYSFQARG